ncbi:hypothetical protein PGT21_050070 [Puccinia graminis f. sp. tritici]|uniref:CCHC-type domain-containing protein n=1 Tax=Puccinia graminis f. sp. tritici TaxID=56615 RepID=A0A5B0S7J3_PUCGR|nr:hypothetical protein PGT21_050070 [Puccinia graminis f. sp. tritici]KAA1133419.1 hypothetical protein PGTUg99_050265 [Puccinia graminis f. sp. tritici]
MSDNHTSPPTDPSANAASAPIPNPQTPSTSDPNPPVNTANSTPANRQTTPANPRQASTQPASGVRDQPPHINGTVTQTESAPKSRSSRQTEADFDRTTAGIISSITGQIQDGDRLLPDGSNYAIWHDFVNERMRDAVNSPFFYYRPTTNILHERVGRSILLSSVDRSMRRGLSRLDTAHHMWQDIRIRFHSVSRAAQMNLFRRLISFNVAEHQSPAEMTTHISDILDEMESIRMPFTRDHLAGLVLQNGLSSDPELQTEFDRRVEFDLQQATAENPPMTFTEMIRLIDTIRRQHHFQAANRNTAPSPAPLVMHAAIPDPKPQDKHQMPFPQPHPDNIPDAGDFMAMQVGLCWQCRSPDHMLKNCPMRRRPETFRGNGRSNHNPFRINQPGPMQNGFQSFYPIITPPGFNGIYPQHQRPYGPHNNNSPQPQQNRPADFYRPPQYRSQRAPTQSESIGSQRPRPTANEAETEQNQVGESTARMVEIGDLADDLANGVRFDHIQATESDNVPIVDSVATSGNPAFITGEGDLTFSGLDNQNVTIHGVLY